MEENVNNFDSKTKSSPPEIKYVRPFDRSPDKDFQFRNDEEKKIICKSRSLKMKIHDKIKRLENDVEQREKEVEVERELRLEAEKKLNSCYQDMYDSREVNQELRERLPRANKSDPFKSERNDNSETDLSSIEEQIVVEEEDSQASSQPKMKADESEVLQSPVVRRKEKRSRSPRSSPKQSPKSSPKSSRRNLDFSDDKNASRRSGVDAQTGIDGASSLPFSSLSPPIRGMYGHPYGASPYMPYSGGLLSGTYPGLSPNFGSPLLHSSSLLSSSMLHRTMSSPSRNVHPGLSERPMTQTLSAPTLASNPANSSLSSSESTPPTATTSAADTTVGASSSLTPESRLGATGNHSGFYRQYFPSSLPGMNTSVLPDPPFIPSGSPRTNAGPGSSLSPNQNNHITALLNEIDSQRQETRKLKNDLQDKDTELETLKLTLKVEGVNVTHEATNTQQAADLVEEIYAAQKKRDDASAARMKVCNDERDDVMARLRQLEARINSQRDETILLQDLSDDELRFDEDDENEDMYLMLSKLDTPSSADHDTSNLVKKVEALRQRQREVTQEEMQIVMEQRDTALARCRKLEEELLRYQKEADGGMHMDSSIKAKLTAVQQERDLAVAKSKQLNDEIQTLRIYYSLHKSLAAENSYKQQANDTIVSCQEDLSVTKQELEAAKKENDKLATQLRTTTIDKKQLEQALESVSQDKERLQRLANVLKRKLNNLTNSEETHQ